MAAAYTDINKHDPLATASYAVTASLLLDILTEPLSVFPSAKNKPMKMPFSSFSKNFYLFI